MFRAIWTISGLPEAFRGARPSKKRRLDGDNNESGELDDEEVIVKEEIEDEPRQDEFNLKEITVLVGKYYFDLLHAPTKIVSGMFINI